MSCMQQVSIGGKKELCDYLKKAKTEFTENTVASAESITVMDHYLEDWYIFHLPTLLLSNPQSRSLVLTLSQSQLGKGQ